MSRSLLQPAGKENRGSSERERKTEQQESQNTTASHTLKKENTKNTIMLILIIPAMSQLESHDTVEVLIYSSTYIDPITNSVQVGGVTII